MRNRWIGTYDLKELDAEQCAESSGQSSWLKHRVHTSDEKRVAVAVESNTLPPTLAPRRLRLAIERRERPFHEGRSVYTNLV